MGGGPPLENFSLYEKKYYTLSHFSVEGRGGGNIFGLNICKYIYFFYIIIWEEQKMSLYKNYDLC